MKLNIEGEKARKLIADALCEKQYNLLKSLQAEREKPCEQRSQAVIRDLSDSISILSDHLSVLS